MKSTMFDSLLNAFFYVILISWSSFFSIMMELQNPANQLMKLLLLNSLILLHDFYQLLQNNRFLAKKLAIKGYVGICSLMPLLLISLYQTMRNDQGLIVNATTNATHYAFSYYWPVVFLIPSLIIISTEFFVAVEKSYINHTKNDTLFDSKNIASAAKQV